MGLLFGGDPFYKAEEVGQYVMKRPSLVFNHFPLQFTKKYQLPHHFSKPSYFGEIDLDQYMIGSRTDYI